MLCPRDDPMPVSQVLQAELELLELSRPVFSKGSQCMMHIHTYADDVSIKEIKWAIEKDANTGEEVKKEAPRFTRSFAKCLVHIAVPSPLSVEKVTECAALGQFTLRDEGKTIAMGRVLRFIPLNKDKLGARAAIKASAEATAAANQATAKPDKVAASVFNLETGETEQQKPALDGIAEEEEKE